MGGGRNCEVSDSDWTGTVLDARVVLDGVTGTVLRLERLDCLPGCLGGGKSPTDGERSSMGGGTVCSGEENLPDEVVGEETVEVVVEVMLRPM